MIWAWREWIASGTTFLDGGSSPTYNIEDDLVLQKGFALMPRRPAQPALTIQSGAEPPADASLDVGAASSAEAEPVRTPSAPKL